MKRNNFYCKSSKPMPDLPHPMRLISVRLTLFCLIVFACFLYSSHLYAQDAAFRGQVKDAEGNILPQVSVSAVASKASTATDAEGNFRLPSNLRIDTLVFSAIGYETIKKVQSISEFANMILARSEETIDEIVVVGFGTQKKVNLTGAVAQIDGKELTNRPVANIGLALQGTVGNLNISPNGGPGGAVNYNVRGATSLSSNGSPLFVVDGIPTNDNGMWIKLSY